MDSFEVRLRWRQPLTESGRSICQQVARLEHLPSLPEVLVGIHDLIADESVSVDRVVERLELDPALCSRILRLVNSAFYGVPRRVSSIARAAVLLGFNTIKLVALGATVIDLFEDGEDGPYDIWQHSVLCGAYATALGHRLGLENRDALFVAGLLHDLGKFVLREVAPEEYERIRQESQSQGRPLHEVEKETLAVDHPEIVGILARAWGFPEGLALLLESHQRVPSRSRFPAELEPEAHVLFAANLLAHDHPDEGLDRLAPREEDRVEMEVLLASWGITSLDRDQMLRDVQRRADGALDALGYPGLGASDSAGKR